MSLLLIYLSIYLFNYLFICLFTLFVRWEYRALRYNTLWLVFATDITRALIGKLEYGITLGNAQGPAKRKQNAIYNKQLINFKRLIFMRKSQTSALKCSCKDLILGQ